MSKEAIIELTELTKKYDDITAVDRLTLSVYQGEIFGLLGPNGAGKTTTILMLLGLCEPTAGKMKVCGLDPTYQPILVKEKVGYLPDEVGFYENLSGLENLLFTAALNRIPPATARRRAEALLEQVGIADRARDKVQTYSRGMKQRLGLADILIREPEIIILDEPTNGIDPEGVRELISLIRELSRERGMTVLLSSHHLYQVQQICDRVGLFVDGKLIDAGPIKELAYNLFKNDPLLLEVEAEPADEQLISLLEANEHVSKVVRNGSRLNIHCRQDISAEIAATIVNRGARLTHLSRHDYGLDEIYHRYFEGGS
ncbi:MAG: ABC transporter ATP-binding protein [Firmicutes bacterium]|jgi:ABC-2 type transport system ATP-binding protein|nr:ABC transporter ATP-binding protein [Bacillota bacterium]